MLAQREERGGSFFRQSRKMNHIFPFCASKVCLHPEYLRESVW
ncbi:MAG: hypothetical protein U5L45_12150 [Saprospiraceae bacterium]|nr:hypothetical protein [Saprospiraceae bacterium]